MKENLGRSFVLTGKILSLVVLSFVAVWLLTMLIGDANLALKFPLINSFVHSDLVHLFGNLLIIFLLLNSEINNYSLKQLYIITTSISLIYFPLYLIGLPDFIGLSGLVYFLLTRFLFSVEKFKILIYLIPFFLFVFEAWQIKNPDGISHGVHLLGIILGTVSVVFHERFSGYLKEIFIPIKD
jgi:membrane associated rhomboid family serine protease